MPKKRDDSSSSSNPLPQGWDIGRDYDGKIYYINHNERKTTWADPRHCAPGSHRPMNVEDEGPNAWDPALCGYSRGVYYHPTNQTSKDPHVEWRALQEEMLKSYLVTAETDLRTKQELVEIKEQRLNLAEEEYRHLRQHLNTTLSTSTSSLNSTGSTVSTKYDPDLLRVDVVHARSRVQRLKRELANIDSEMSYKQIGVETLSRVNDKFHCNNGVSPETGQCLTMDEAQAIRLELYNIQQSLTTGEQEKIELMKSLACLKDDLTRLQHSDSSYDVSTNPLDILSTASQTDLSGELVPVGARLAEMARLRLRYDDARKSMLDIQQRLASLEDRMSPGQLESDKDRLLLIQEKEQLLRELRSITPRSRSHQEMSNIKREIYKLESDLNNAMEISNRCIADRLKLHEEKQLLLQQLMESMRSVASLESQLKLLSASTLSMSSSSSLGSLSSSHASSKGSLSSLSFTDIYGLSSTTSAEPAMLDLHRRIDKILIGSQPHNSEDNPPESSSAAAPAPYYLAISSSTTSVSPRSSLSSVSPPVIPDYSIIQKQFVEISEGRKLSTINEDQHHHRPSINSEHLSSISESDLEVQNNNNNYNNHHSSSSMEQRTDPRSISNESVAGDSGVFESKSNTKDDNNVLPAIMNLETAQVQIKLKYVDPFLHVGIEKARNLSVLFIPNNRKICIKVALLPRTSTQNASSFCTRPLPDLQKPNFGETFVLSVPSKKLTSKTLQITIWAVFEESSREDCLGSAQVSLADFDPKSSSLRWYNILSFHFMQQPMNKHRQQYNELVSTASRQGTLKEESSDESTIISSQTSTLTRNVDPDSMTNHAGEDSSQQNFQESDDDEDENEDLCVSSMKMFVPNNSTGKSKDLSDKETNTDYVFANPSSAAGGEAFSHRLNSSDTVIVKRSQTFTPSAPIDKTDYICKLNRSDSDSAMPLYKRLSFKRSVLERRSLRIPVSHSSSSSSSSSSSKRHIVTPIDLELDLAAQHTKLQLLKDEIERLKAVKSKMEEAKDKGEKEVPTWLQEQESFQHLLNQIEMQITKTSEDRKIEKMMKKTGKDIYKLRKTRAPKGEPDIRSFKEKMAFFTSLRANIPILASTSEEYPPSPVPSPLQPASDTEDTASECSTLTIGEPPPSFGYKISTARFSRLDESSCSSETVNTLTGEERTTSQTTSSADTEPKQKFTYEIDPVIGVIV